MSLSPPSGSFSWPTYARSNDTLHGFPTRPVVFCIKSWRVWSECTKRLETRGAWWLETRGWWCCWHRVPYQGPPKNGSSLRVENQVLGPKSTVMYGHPDITYWSIDGILFFADIWIIYSTSGEFFVATFHLVRKRAFGPGTRQKMQSLVV